MAATAKKKNFSSLDIVEAMERLGLDELKEWRLEFAPLSPTPFFAERMRRLQHFDLTANESSKEFLIEAICEDALERHPTLRVWKAAPLSSDELTGTANYWVAKRRRYLKIPLLCLVEAKKDDFEQGLAQCLAEMEACQWRNRQAGRNFDIYGIVTNGAGWMFYLMTAEREVFESLLYSTGNLEDVLGALDYVFGKCVENLALTESDS